MRKPRRKHFDPHKFVGKIVVYGLAAESGLQFVKWLVEKAIHDLFH